MLINYANAALIEDYQKGFKCFLAFPFKNALFKKNVRTKVKLSGDREGRRPASYVPFVQVGMKEAVVGNVKWQPLVFKL